MIAPDTPRIAFPADPAAFARLCSLSLATAALIVEQMLPTLDQLRREGIDVVMRNGGTLCVESSLDGVGATRVTLTCVASNGARHEIASAHVPDRPTPGAQ